MNKWIVFVFFLLTSCSSKQEFKLHTFHSSTWNFDEKIVFEVAGKEGYKDVSLHTEIFYNQEFANKNIFLRIRIIDPKGNASESLKNIILFDNYGNPLGQGISSTKKITFVSQELYDLSLKGNYTLEVSHYMRTNILKGINAVGIFFVTKKL